MEFHEIIYTKQESDYSRAARIKCKLYLEFIPTKIYHEIFCTEFLYNPKKFYPS